MKEAKDIAQDILDSVVIIHDFEDVALPSLLNGLLTSLSYEYAFDEEALFSFLYKKYAKEPFFLRRVLPMIRRES